MRDVPDAMMAEGKDYFYGHARGNPSHRYLLPVLEKVMAGFSGSERRAVDVGCGNGFVSDFMVRMGFRVTGVDPSAHGIRLARNNFKAVEFYQGSAYEDLQEILGTFDLTVSLEVVEHVYSPRRFAETLFLLTRPDGTCVVSTPYHGYLKNLGLAISGRLERHWNPLHEGGHIKFFSVRQLTTLLENAGFTVRQIHRVGRIPCIAKSVIAVVKRPA